MKAIFLFAALVCVIALPAAAAPQAAVQIIHPWIALPPGGAPTAAGYAVVKNQGRTTDTFLGASTPRAEDLELHSMSTAGGIMRMRRVAGGVAIAPGQTLTLAPNGAYHFMFVRPSRPLKSGDRIPATLTFAKAGAVKTVFVVQPAQGIGMSMR